jgi:hypothetical protein
MSSSGYSWTRLARTPCGEWFGNIVFFRTDDSAFLLNLHVLLDSARSPSLVATTTPRSLDRIEGESIGVDNLS